MKFAAFFVLLGFVSASCSDDPAIRTNTNNGWDVGAEDMENDAITEDMSTTEDMPADMPVDEDLSPDMTEPDMEPLDLCALIDCQTPENPCENAVCNPANGMCELVLRDNGTTCDDGDACTLTDVCTAGVCGGVALDCSATAGVCEVAACVNGTCESSPGLGGESCDLASFCSWEDSCSMGSCALGYVGDCGLLNVFHRATASTTNSGGTGGAPFSDVCPQGQVPIGMRGAFATSTAYDDNITKFVTICGEVQVNSGVVTVVEATDLPSRSSTTSTASETRLCPADHVIVGISGGVSSGYVSAITPKCAPLSVSGDAENGYSFTVGTAVNGPGLIGSPGVAFGPLDCPAGSVARGTFGGAGEVIDAIGLLCGELYATRVTTAPTLGSSTGGMSTLDCPDGQVPYGVSGSVAQGFWSGILNEFTVKCAQVVAADDDNGGWAVTRNDVGDVLPATGTLGIWQFSGSIETKECPANQFVVGISTYSRTHLDYLQLECAPISVAGSPSTGFVTSYGATTSADALGTDTSGTFSGPYTCPEGTVSSGFYARSGEILDGLALRCSEPFITTP